jgi:ribonuclease P protein component
MLPKEHRLKKSVYFDKVYKNGTHLKGNFGKLIYLAKQSLRQPKDSPTKIGVVVPGKLGKAHARNKAKRRIRAIFHENLQEIPDGLFISYILWNIEFDFQDMKKDIQQLISKIPALD